MAEATAPTMDAAGAKRLATGKELADYLGVPLQTIYKWRSNGTAPSAIRVGRHVRYRWSDIQAWIDRHAVDGAS